MAKAAIEPEAARTPKEASKESKGRFPFPRLPRHG